MLPLIHDKRWQLTQRQALQTAEINYLKVNISCRDICAKCIYNSMIVCQNWFTIIFRFTIKNTKEYDPTIRTAFLADGKYGSDFLVTGLILKQKTIRITLITNVIQHKCIFLP